MMWGINKQVIFEFQQDLRPMNHSINHSLGVSTGGKRFLEGEMNGVFDATFLTPAGLRYSEGVRQYAIRSDS